MNLRICKYRKNNKIQKWESPKCSAYIKKKVSLFSIFELIDDFLLLFILLFQHQLYRPHTSPRWWTAKSMKHQKLSKKFFCFKNNLIPRDLTFPIWCMQNPCLLKQLCFHELFDPMFSFTTSDKKTQDITLVFLLLVAGGFMLMLILFIHKNHFPTTSSSSLNPNIKITTKTTNKFLFHLL